MGRFIFSSLFFFWIMKIGTGTFTFLFPNIFSLFLSSLLLWKLSSVSQSWESLMQDLNLSLESTGKLMSGGSIPHQDTESLNTGQENLKHFDFSSRLENKDSDGHEIGLSPVSKVEITPPNGSNDEEKIREYDSRFRSVEQYFCLWNILTSYIRNRPIVHVVFGLPLSRDTVTKILSVFVSVLSIIIQNSF